MPLLRASRKLGTNANPKKAKAWTLSAGIHNGVDISAISLKKAGRGYGEIEIRIQF